MIQGWVRPLRVTEPLSGRNSSASRRNQRWALNSVSLGSVRFKSQSLRPSQKTCGRCHAYKDRRLAVMHR